MRIAELTVGELDRFKGLDPFEILDREDIQPTLTLGVYETDERRDGEIPAGLLLAVRREEAVVILWLFVAGAYRGKGVGEHLLSGVFAYAAKKRCPQVAAVFSAEYGRELVCAGETAYFAAHGFAETKKGIMTAQVADYQPAQTEDGVSLEEIADPVRALFGEVSPLQYEAATEAEERAAEDAAGAVRPQRKNWRTRTFTLRDVAGPITHAMAAARRSDVKQRMIVGKLGDLSLPQLAAGLKLCVDNDHTGFLDNLTEMPVTWFDAEISAFAMRERKVCGLFLVSHDGTADDRALTVELLFASGSDSAPVLTRLLAYSAAAAREKVPPETRIIVPCDETLHQLLVERLLGKG